jgi:hypothetical protein
VALAVGLLAEDAVVTGGIADVGDFPLRGLPGDVAALAAFRFSDTFFPGVLATQLNVARFLGHGRGYVLEQFMAELQTVAPLAAGMLAVAHYLGPTRAYALFEASGSPGRNTGVYGVHKADGWGPVERRLGLAAVGPDTRLTVTSHALVTGTRHDPASADQAGREKAACDMEHWGFDAPSTVTEHAVQNLRILGHARAVLKRAVERHSAVCQRAGIDPQVVLDLAFPPWVVAGRIQYGPPVNHKILTQGKLLEPGLDSGLLIAVTSEGGRPVFRAGDNRTTLDDQASSLALVSQTTSLAGPPLFGALFAFETKSVPALHALTGPDVEVLEAEIARRHLALSLDGVRIATVPTGLLLMGNGAPVRVAAIVLRTMARTTVWLTPVDISEDKWIVPTVMALLAQQSEERSPWASCTSRFIEDFGVFQEQASSYRGRNGLRLLKIITNLVVAGVARAAEAGAIARGGSP